MRINNNIMAMNANRQLSINNTGMAKSLEKLSSGLRINRAGDDAAGLSISEKMRGQIRGLVQASRNAQDGISLIQTAEGALNETHAILQRMRELAVQAANDTNVEVDRQAIQDEMDQLMAELDGISERTEFNTQKLLDGSFKGTFQIGANQGQTVKLQLARMDTASLGLTTAISTGVGETETTNTLQDGVYFVNVVNNDDSDDNDAKALVDVHGNVVASIEEGTEGSETITIIKANDKDAIKIKDMKLAEDAQIIISNGGKNFEVKNTITVDETTKQLAPGTYEIKGDNVIKDGKLFGTIGSDGSTIKPEDGTEINITYLGLVAIGNGDTTEFTIHGADVTTRETAEGTIAAIDNAIQKVSAERSKLGAMQNRLEHTIRNLDNAAENLTAAESRIRDVDMAKEMMEFTKQTILQQAATAMLAQAGNLPSSVLQLLR